MSLRRRCPSALLLLLAVAGLLAALFFVRRMKHLYDDHQKYHRLQGYQQFLEEVSEGMETLERSANRSVEKLQRLNAALQRDAGSRGR